MNEAKGKYGGLLSEIRQEQQATPRPASAPLLPAKPPPPVGKRSDPAYIQKGVLLKKESIARASEKLKRRHDRTDFSDLMQAMLDAWLNGPES